MDNMCIPLPNAIPGREYIIHSIAGEAAIASSCKGYGIFPGSRIKLVFNSPAKDPSAYEVMGAVLALRREDSRNIIVSPAPGAME